MKDEKRATPPLNALRAFDAVARLGSMNKAAQALGLSPSSVTQHIRNLEDFVGGSLIERQVNSIRLSPRGARYAADVRAAFDVIQRATSDVSQDVSSRPIRLSCVPNLAGPVIAAQLADLQTTFPEIEVRCEFAPTLVDFEADDIDIAVRYGTGDYPGTVCDLIHVDTIAPVCSAATAKTMGHPDDLAGVTRLDSVETAPNGLSLWRYWAERTGHRPLIDASKDAPWILQSAEFTVDVLKAIPSAAILERAQVSDLIATGDLVAPFDDWVAAPFGYYIVTPKRRVLHPAAKRLKALLKRALQSHFDPTG